MMTKSELLYGVEVSPRRTQDATALQAFLPHVAVLAFPDDAAMHYAQIRADLMKRGQMIGANGLFIAALTHAASDSGWSRTTSPSSIASKGWRSRIGQRGRLVAHGRQTMRRRRRWRTTPKAVQPDDSSSHMPKKVKAAVVVTGIGAPPPTATRLMVLSASDRQASDLPSGENVGLAIPDHVYVAVRVASRARAGDGIALRVPLGE